MAVAMTTSMCAAACVVVVVLSLAAQGSDGATPATLLPPVRVVVLSPMMAVHRVHGRRLEDDRQAADDADAEMDMDSEVHRRVVHRVLQGTSPPYLAYGSINADHAACGSSCVGRPGAPYLPASRPCAEYYHCPSTPA